MSGTVSGSQRETGTLEVPEILNSARTDTGLSAASAQAFAASAGDYRVAVMREVHRILVERKESPLEAARVGLERLAADRLITQQERLTLDRICDAVASGQSENMKSKDVSSRVRAEYDRLLVDGTASPVALAIASIASSGSVAGLPSDGDLPEGAIARISSSDQVDMGIVGGAIVGGAIGGAIGGLGGAAIGAVVGGIAGGVATACST